ncbi:MAG: PqqD family protein [Longimicrobiales bacterium]
MSATESSFPKARRKDLVVEELPDETLVYDLERDKAHCLNPTAALVWRRCDGNTSVADMAALLEQEMDLPADQSLVWMALDRLGKARLLEEPVTLPGQAARYSRREMMRTLGRVAGLTLVLPVVSSIVAPLAAMQGSCIPKDTCNGDVLVPPNCTGLPICEKPNKCCIPKNASSCRAKAC